MEFNFGDRLRKLRKEKKLSQKELGDLLNISDRVISYYENNNRFPSDEKTLKAIADFFDVSVDYLLGRVEEKDIAIMEGEDIPKEIREIGMEWIKVNKEFKEKGFTPEQLKAFLKALEELKENNNKN